MKVYISGKIGQEDITPDIRDKFLKAQRAVEAQGQEAFNPTDPDWQKDLRKGYERAKAQQPNGDKVSFYAYCLLRDMMVLATCDCILLLDVKDILGSLAEWIFSSAIGLPFFAFGDGEIKLPSQADVQIAFDQNIT